MSDLGFAIPFFSGLPFLRRALESLQAQSTPQWRAVVVDDGGPEPESGELVRGLQDPRISYVRNDTNLGLAHNWNRCLELVDADFVTLLHGDDELAREYAELVLDAHRRHPDAVAVHTGARVIGPRSSPIFSFPDLFKHFTGPRRRGEHVTVGDSGLAVVLRGQFIFFPSVSFKARLLPSRPFDPAFRQVLDLDLIARLLFAGHNIVTMPRPAYRYRRHGSSQTMLLTASRERFVEEFALYERIAHRADSLRWSRSATVARRARIVRAHAAFRALGLALRGELREARATAALLRTPREARRV